MPIHIDGLSELRDKLINETPRTAKRYLVAAAKPATQVVIDALHRTAPVETGQLDGSMTSKNEFIANDQMLVVRIGPSRDKFWGMFQEFGTVTEPAQHWMARAWESCQDKVLSVFATELLAKLADLEDRSK